MIEAIVAAIIAALVGYFLGGRHTRAKAKIEARNKAIATRERVEDALETSHSGGAAWRDRLHPDK